MARFQVSSIVANMSILVLLGSGHFLSSGRFILGGENSGKFVLSKPILNCVVGSRKTN